MFVIRVRLPDMKRRMLLGEGGYLVNRRVRAVTWKERTAAEAAAAEIRHRDPDADVQVGALR